MEEILVEKNGITFLKQQKKDNSFH